MNKETNLIYGTKSIEIDNKIEPLLKELNFKFKWTLLTKASWSYDDGGYMIIPKEHEDVGVRGIAEIEGKDINVAYIVGNENGIPMGAVFLDFLPEPPKFIFLSTETLQPWKRNYVDNYVKATTLRKLVHAIGKRWEAEDTPFHANPNAFCNPTDLTNSNASRREYEKIEGSEKINWDSANATQTNAQQGAKLVECILSPEKIHTILTQEEIKEYKDNLELRNTYLSLKRRQEENVKNMMTKNFWIVGKDNITDLHYIGKTTLKKDDSGIKLTEQTEWKAYEEVEDYPESDKLIPTLLNINTLRDKLIENHLIQGCYAPYTLNREILYVEDLGILSHGSAPQSMGYHSGMSWDSQWIIIFE